MSDSSAQFDSGLCLLKMGNYKEAIIIFRQILKANNTEENAFLNMGVAYSHLGNIRMARYAYREELKLNPFSKEANYNLAMSFINRRQWSRAIPYLERCFHMGYEVPVVSLNLAKAFYKTGDTRQEMAVYQRILDVDPKSAWALKNLGAAYIDVGNRQQALLHLSRAKRHDPSDESISRNLLRANKLISKS